jgi:hypothetical protein
MDAAAFERLIKVAEGESRIPAYCEGTQQPGDPKPKDERQPPPGGQGKGRAVRRPAPAPPLRRRAIPVQGRPAAERARVACGCNAISRLTLFSLAADSCPTAPRRQGRSFSDALPSVSAYMIGELLNSARFLGQDGLPLVLWSRRTGFFMPRWWVGGFRTRSG